MKKFFTILSVLCMALYSQAETVEVVSTNLRSVQQENSDNLILSGVCDLGNIALYLYGGATKGYGDYGVATDAEGGEDLGTAIFGLIGRVNVEGGGTWSYSDELKSDLLTASLSGNDGKTYNVTMYAAPKDTVDVLCTDLTTKDLKNGWGRFLLLSGTSSQGDVELQIYGYTGAYGTFGWIDAESAAISGEIDGEWAQGAGTWSHSEELNSDLLEANLETEDGKTIYAVTMYKQSAPTAVDNITAQSSTQKIVENGQLIVIKNGVKYNVLGIRL